MNIFDLHEVLGSPALYIFDCHSAGTVLNHFHKLHQHLDREWHSELRRANSAGRSHSGQTHPHLAPHSPPHHQSVFLAACADDQLLPLAPHVPADLFTSCLTTPIKTALRWFARRSLVPHITTAMLDRIPGKYNLRSSPLGDLEYVFTAVSDAIAWNVLPRDLFKRLYRQDVLLASLMRNFLLAQRILRSFGCDPVSYPEIPATHNHPLWQSFDLAMENLLSQLPIMLAKEDMQRRIAAREAAEREAAAAAASAGATSSNESQNQFEMQQNSLSILHHRREDPVLPGIDPDTLSTFVYRPSSFFDDQMKAFDIWLDMGPDFRDPPEQLPVMLQVLLSPAWRVKALQLISRYMQTGPMAVDESLSVGVFPYMSQLLKNHQIREIRNDLVFIWSKILALDDSCRVEIVKSEVDEYFVRFLASSDKPKPVYLACALFVLSVVARDHADRCQKIGAVDACVQYLAHSNSFVRRWACLCLSEILRRAVHRTQLSALANKQLIHLLRQCAVDDLAPDVRAAAVSTLNAIMAGVLRHVSREIKSEANTRPSPSHLDANGSGPIVVDSTAGGTDGSASTTSSVPSSSPPPVPPVSTPRVAGVHATSTTPSSSATTNISPGQPSSPLPQTTATESPTETNYSTNNDLQTAPQPPDPNQRAFLAQPNTPFDTDILDATVPPYSKDESDALLKIGVVLSSIARRESSVLVRREVAIAVAELEKVQRDRFIRAALLTEMCSSANVTQSDDLTPQCEAVYRSLWTTLSELAFDPHPVDAAIARRSYDKIYDVIMERTAPFPSTGTDDTGDIGDHDAAEPALFSQSSRASSAEMLLPTRQVDPSLGDNDPPASTIVSPDVVESTSTAPQDAWRKEDLGSSSAANIDTRGSEPEAQRPHVGSPVHSSNVAVVNRTSAQLPKSHTFQSPPLRSPSNMERTREAAALGLSPSQHKHASLPPHPLIRDRVTRTNSAGSQRGIRPNRGMFDSPTRMVTGSVHVRSSSGSFDLRPSRLAQNIPTMSALHTDNVDHLGRERHANASGWGRKECDDEDDTLSEPGQRLEDVNEGDRPGSVPKSHVIGNVGQPARLFSPPWFSGGVGVDKTGMGTEMNIDRQTTPLASSPGIPAAVTGIEGGVQLTANALQTTYVASGMASSSVIMTRRRLPKSMSSLSGLRVVARSQAPDDNDVQAISPPRPPKRTHSYSVLNAVNSLGSNRVPLFSPSEKTSYFAVMEASEDAQVRERVPAGYSQLLKSGEGNAALSLYEWSSAYISRAEVEASSLDDSKEEEAIPKYATLWSNIKRKTGSEKVAERLRKFALLGKGDDVIGMEEQLDDLIGNDDNVQGENVADQEVDDLLILNNHNKRNSNTNSELIIDDKDNSQPDGQFNSSADTPNSMPTQKQQEQEQTDSSEAHTQQFLQPKLSSDSQHSQNHTMRRQGAPPFQPLARGVDTRHEFAKAKQLSLYAMGAGGGSVSALAFLPRDLGIGDDQLVATGDTHGAVGVYDARTGKCQVAFGIPVPPGGREEGVSSILCLNPHGDDNDSSSSHSALILAGSFDGRVAVFKNDFSRPNDFRIMTTFQASGRTTTGKVLTWHDNNSSMLTSPNTILDTTSKSSSMPVHQQLVNTWAGNSGMVDAPGSTNMMNMNNMSNAEEEAPSYVDALKQHGKGLVLAFNTDTARLAAGGLDGDIVRVWNLESERCVWEGSCVSPGQWPTAVTMWKQHHPSVFVVGSSDGVVTLMDMRERGRNRVMCLQGKHSTCDPIMSIGTCVGNAGGGTGSESASEVIVSADYGGQIAFWDARWTNRSGMNGAATTTMTTADDGINDVDPYQREQSQQLHQHPRQLQSKGVLNKIRVIQAHDHSLTTMCVHRSGRYIASGSLHGVKIFGRDLKHGQHGVLNTQQQHQVVSHQRQHSGDESTIPVAAKVLSDGHDVHEVSRKDHLQPVTALAFQHETSLLAIGCMNGAVMVYGKERDLFPGIGMES